MSLEKTFKALADPKRREILDLLKAGDRTVGELGEAFDMTGATLSYHLNLLKEADLVIDSKVGNFRVYSLRTSVFEEILRYFMTFKERNDE
ncbi:autorepressor SdpR family transcription factor [Peptoniphilus equinus]|uniref:Autorepressor SdpR family transcription factor n=1 Tax=Peptoniphilus equinus TaxID=3016343 RepID=A0ABY7QUE1_9FIRM|nr:autorepressor SdpR family transcription factor [Peptoniphilus equinus]WBW49793.1 autorepressor SdpR family transcription factor [Peptoniphilus equinus]